MKQRSELPNAQGQGAKPNLRTRIGLAEYYGCCRQTIAIILKQRLGIMHSKRLSNEELQCLFDRYGTPTQLRNAEAQLR